MIAPLAIEAGAGAPVDLLPLALVLLAAWTAGWVATRAGYPAVLGELVAGILLGPPLLGVLSDGAGLAAIGELGIVLMMLYIGTEIDLDDLRRASRAGLLAAVGGFVVPFAAGVATMLLFGFDMTAAIFVGAAVGVTSLATKSRILADLRLFDTRIAYVLVAGALLSDTATLVLFAGVLSFHEGSGGAGETAMVAVNALGFFAIMAVAGLLVPRAGRLARERLGLDGRAWGTGVLVVGGLLAAALAEVMGLHAILGAFVAGMILRRGVLTRRTAHQAAEFVGRISIGVLAPVFFVTAGFAISLPAAAENITLLVAVVLVATLGKVLGTALFYLPTGHGWREGLVIGGAMNGRGAVEIIVAGIGLERGLISTEVFTVLVLMAVLTTATVPVLLKVGVEWLRGRGELADADGSRRTVTIVGSGAVARAFAAALGDHREVWLLDANPDRVARARHEGHDAVVGDALDVEALRRARADEAVLLLAITPNAEVNVLAAELAREEFAVRELRVAQGHPPAPGTRVLLERIGAQPLADGPVDVERWDGWLQSDAASVTTVVVTDEAQAVELHDRLTADAETMLPLAVRRADDAIPYVLVDRLRLGDHVTVVTRQPTPETPGATPATEEVAPVPGG